ncbi:MAG: DMT family transporter [Bacteroidia bacterium]|nr:DMT family transporter [Bacteroidia bacterium]
MKYIPALFTAIVWGSTFIASKHIITHGIEPCVIMIIRFVLAYISLWILYPKYIKFHFNKDELKFLLVGLSGGSVYFLFEYQALQHTTAINVGLLTSTVPITGTALQYLFYRQRPTKYYLIGSLIAFIGVSFVILSPLLQTSDISSLSVNLLGDSLCIISVLLWSVYSLVLDRIPSHYSPFFVSRRLFFYSIITILPFVVAKYNPGDIEAITSDISCLFSVIYLGIFASATCMWLWNWSFQKIGLSHTNMFLYLMPLVSLITATCYNSSEFTLWATLGAILIFIGIVLADYKGQA